MLEHPAMINKEKANNAFFISLSPFVLQKVSTEIYSVVPSSSVPASIHHKAHAGSNGHKDGEVTCYLPAGSLHGSTY